MPKLIAFNTAELSGLLHHLGYPAPFFTQSRTKIFW